MTKPPPSHTPPFWQEHPTSDYLSAVRMMQSHVDAMLRGRASEVIFLTEHNPVYTAGTSALDHELLNRGNIPIHRTGRGGQWTYHAPGQLIIWPILDLNKRQRDIRAYIYFLESWMIDTLGNLGLEGFRRENFPGIWVKNLENGGKLGNLGNFDDGRKLRDLDKIVAVGVRLIKWVTMHGLALNYAIDLEGFKGIIPCGVQDGGVTNLKRLGVEASREEVVQAVKNSFDKHFGQGTMMEIQE